MNSPSNKSVLSVTDLTVKIKDSLESIFSDVWVEGEISGLKVHTSGHCYFSLKDENAQISCNLWKNSVLKLKFKPENGSFVLIRGSVNVYAPQGKYSLNVTSIEPKGIGALQLAYEQLKQRLSAEGLFKQERKKKLPYLVLKIGVVTSQTGAVFQDIKTIIFRRFPNITIVLSPARVQGFGAGEDIARAINNLNIYSDVDIIIVARGGGSIEDLYCFNEEVVARAIAKSNIPIVSAVGHEVDYTIADFVADLRAPTPSAAAEMVVKNKQDLEDKIFNIEKTLLNHVQHKIQTSYLTLEALKEHLISPFEKIQSQIIILKAITIRLEQSFLMFLKSQKQLTMMAENYLGKIFPRYFFSKKVEKINYLDKMRSVHFAEIFNFKKKQLQILVAKLEALSPLQVLMRGFSIVQNSDKSKIITNTFDLEEGDLVHVKLNQGSITCNIVDIIEEES